MPLPPLPAPPPDPGPPGGGVTGGGPTQPGGATGPTPTDPVGSGGTADPGTPAGGTTGGGSATPPAPAPTGTGTTPGRGPTPLPRGAGTAGPNGSSTPLPVGGATPSFKKAPSLESATTWHWWWQFNRERFRAHDSVDEILSRTNLSADESRQVSITEAANDRRVIRDQVASLLRRALADADDSVRAEAVFALGKAGDASHFDAIRRLVADESLIVRRHALLSLGLLGDEQAAGLLIDAMKNAPKGRAATGIKGDIDDETRSYAAVAIGYLGTHTNLAGTGATEALMETVEGRHHTSALNIAAAVSLGLVRSSAAVPGLIAFLEDTSRDEDVRSACANALGKIGDRTAAKALLAALKDKRSSVRRSAAIAIGLVGSAEDAATVKALVVAATTAADRTLRNFAIISLGEIGGVEAKSLLLSLAKSADAHDQTFAALALASAASKHGGGDADAIGDMLLGELNGCDDCPRRGAMILALGILGHRPAAPTLIEIMRTHEHPDLRVYCAQALGIMQAKEAVSDLVVQLNDRSSDELRAAAATALGMIGSREALSALAVGLHADASVAIGGAAVRGLGKTGDQAVVFGLGKWLGLTGESFTSQVRTFAALALGIIGDKDQMPITARLAQHSNYIAQYNTLRSLFDRI